MDFSNPRVRRSPVEVNLTPLIDIVFILLIFFLITSTFVTNEGIEVDKPSAGSSEELSPSDSIAIGITKEGQYIHERTIFSKDELIERLKVYKEERAGATIIIQGDTAAQLGKVVELMDIARQSGYRDIAIATDSE
ncbi:MAG: biopolymer transporter ExbD [Myxococcota bacterium]